jgi:hypothetical protein
MDANQRSEVNNQTNNGANEKWTPGATGKSAENGAPLDHTYPQGLGVQQQGNQQRDIMGTQQSGMGPGAAPGGMGARESGGDSGVPGGSMETQINGGSGPVQGITDSHQRQMEQKSAAYGMLEQPVGHRPHDSGVNLNQQRSMQDEIGRRDDVRGRLPSQSTAQPDLQGGSLGPRGGNLNMQGDTRGGGMAGPLSQQQAASQMSGSMGNRQSADPVSQGDLSTTGGGKAGHQSGGQSSQAGGQEAQRGNTQEGVAGSRAGADQEADFGGVHQSNDAAGGLPRSPGNSGASTDRAGSQTGAGGREAGTEDVHKSNDAAGGYPRSPGFANRLAGDSNMDDDTGFKRK